MTDPHTLERFVAAQEGIYETALAEIRAGRKATHWMWFVFPQVAGLGQSAMSRKYAIRSLHEARAYLAHPVLGPRLIVCASAALAAPARTAELIFGGNYPTKLRSSMTLFMRADPSCTVFASVLDKFFGGVADEATDALLHAFE